MNTEKFLLTMLMDEHKEVRRLRGVREDGGGDEKKITNA